MGGEGDGGAGERKKGEGGEMSDDADTLKNVSLKIQKPSR